MDRKQANKILGNAEDPNSGLYSLKKEYLRWKVGDEKATLDGNFTADELEATAWWMRKNNKQIVLAIPIRSLKRAFRYWRPKRLTLESNPRLHAWLWWNF